MTISTVSQTLTPFPTAPSREQDQTTFTTNAENHVTALGVHVQEVNTLIGQINTTVAEVNTDIEGIDEKVTQAETAETNAENSATSAANSASLAALTANNLGAWSSLTGSFTLGNSVNHNESVWIANVDIADVTLSEPSSTNSDWTEASSSGIRWESPQTSNFTLVKGKKYPIDASTGSVDAALPSTITVGGTFVIHNNANSLHTVRITNSGYTIRGSKGAASTSDNIVISPGQTASLVAVTTSFLEIV